MEIRISSEDYLEAILILKNKLGNVRNVDIAEYMGYSKPSITNAITVLRKGGYVTTDKDKNIFLTDAGQEIAEKIYAKYEFFRKYLIAVGVDEETAAKDACKMEHAISDESFERVKDGICTDKERHCFECGKIKCPAVPLQSNLKKL